MTQLLSQRAITIPRGVKRVPAVNIGESHCAKADPDHCVFATVCPVCATETNCFAFNTPRPSGVGMEK
jgi:hypothetical protein